jgi:hypothetical protein
MLSRQSRSTLLQARLSHTPDQMIEAILAEEGFVLEHKQRHAPMAGIVLIGFILCDFSGQRFAFIAHLGIERAGVEPGCGQRVREVVAFVPIVDLA